MSQLVQSACPGCKNLLRIPAEWLHQQVRCKHCGLVLQVKQPTASARPSAPAARKAQVTAAPAVPAAAPAPSGSPFADLTAEEEETSYRRARRRRKQGTWWKLPVLSLAVLAIAVVVTIVNWDRIIALLPLPDEQPAAQKDKDKDPVAEPPPKQGEFGKTPTTARVVSNKRPSKSNDLFPRLALVISVHDYLYANPIHHGPHSPPGAHSIKTFIDKLSLGFKIPLNQIAHLSDEANKGPRAPTRPVIEKTLANFLDSSRAQDHIMVFFIGHSVELGDDVYLAPVEGELDNAATLIPLKWFYEKLAGCKARQKVLVLDVNRYNQTFGQERPGSGEMGPKLDALLKEPPAGVQVWSACSPKQRSYETDDSEMGVFLDAFQNTISTVMEKALLGKIQHPEDPLPVEPYVAWINERMKEELGPLKLEQVSRLTGKEADAGATFDKNEPPASDAVASLAPAPKEIAANKALIESVLDQIGTPPVKVTHEMALRYDALPPFSADMLQKYQNDPPDAESPLPKAIKDARAALWAIYPSDEPRALSAEVRPIREMVRVRLNVLKEGYTAPTAGKESQLKDRVFNDERDVARLLRAMQDALEGLESEAVVEAKSSASKRWKANYDFMHARIQLEYAYLYEYQSMLGKMRQEFPPLDTNLYKGWKLASQADMQGDSKGKRFANNARKLLDKMIKDHAGTPWAVLAKREKLTNLGLEWQPAK
jgi:hypothetical protein